MAAYGLYSHIESNKRRSIALLVGLFALVYLLVYAGALAGEAMSYNASLQYLAGKATMIGFFVGQVIKASKGQANPQVVNELLAKKLG